MKTSEFKKILKENGCTLKKANNATEVRNEYCLLAEIDAQYSGEYGIWSAPSVVVKAVVDYAMTPIEERKDEKRWIVVIGSDATSDSIYSTAWFKNCSGFNIASMVLPADLEGNKDFIFTDSEIADLLNQIEKLPNGCTYERIAELGKREVLTDAD